LTHADPGRTRRPVRPSSAGGLANEKRERAIKRRIRDASFGEVCLLEQFNWDFERTIHRQQIEELTIQRQSKSSCK
jgi:hypothetical protein